MNILLTNDDGIHAPGIIALHDALTDPDARYGGPIAGPATTVFTVAPLTVQSATGHGVTFHKPLMVRHAQVTPRMSGLAVDARPADCVKLAVASLWPEHFGDDSRPDLVVSGMNAGANVGINVIYSGTVAAALEAAFLGVPAIAVSLHLGSGRPRFDAAAARARRVIEQILEHGLRPHECLSINIPITESGGPMPPVRVCPMNTHGLVDKFIRRESPDGQRYYWPAGHGLDFRNLDQGSDVDHLIRRCITLTPLSYDLSRHDALHRWAAPFAADAHRDPTPDAGTTTNSPADEGD